MIEASPQKLLTADLGALLLSRMYRILLEQNLNPFEVIPLSLSVTTSVTTAELSVIPFLRLKKIFST